MNLALAAGLEAVAHAGADAATLPAVFTSSGGDGHNCHEICRTLASSERQLSPTRFHNSVHNAAAGYWGIATGATPASNALCAYDASFGAGLLEALTQVVTGRSAVLLVAYDASYPEPLYGARPIPHAFGVALVLAPAPRDAPARPPRGAPERRAARHARGCRSRERCARRYRRRAACRCWRGSRAAAPGRVMLDYLEPWRIAVEVQACL